MEFNNFSNQTQIIKKVKLIFELNYEDKKEILINNEEANGNNLIPKSNEYEKEEL